MNDLACVIWLLGAGGWAICSIIGIAKGDIAMMRECLALAILSYLALRLTPSGKETSK